MTYKRVRYSLKKRGNKAFEEKSVLLDKIKDGVHSEHYRPVYFYEAVFAASPPIQYGWDPRGQPHMLELRNHCCRSVPDASGYSNNMLFYKTESGSTTRADVTYFLEQVARQGDERLTILVLGDPPVHRRVDEETRKICFFEHSMCLLYLPALNLIEMVWKQAIYHWRRFINWNKERLESEKRVVAGNRF